MKNLQNKEAYIPDGLTEDETAFEAYDVKTMCSATYAIHCGAGVQLLTQMR